MSPFEGLTNAQKNKLYSLLQVHIYKYNRFQEILPTIKHENIICILLSGSAQIMKIDYNGNEIVTEKLEKDSIFGSNISDISNESCQILAKEYCEVLVIDYNILLSNKNFNYIYFNIFLKNLFCIINDKFKYLNNRQRILEKKTIREKLLEYFEIEYNGNYMKTINLPFSLKDLSEYIGVNRSSMFRELKSLKDEGFIEIKGRRIILLNK